MAGTCLCRYGAAAAPRRALHIHVLIVLQPARPINVVPFQLLDWHKCVVLPISSGVCVCWSTQPRKKQRYSKVFCSQCFIRCASHRLHFSYLKQNMTKNQRVDRAGAFNNTDLGDESLCTSLELHWSGFDRFCRIPHGLKKNFRPRGWNPVFPRQADKKCQEETCTFKGQATGKGLWVGFCCVWQLSVRACCLLPSLRLPKQPKKIVRPLCQSEGWHHRCCKAPNVLGLGINETSSSSCELVDSQANNSKR